MTPRILIEDLGERKLIYPPLYCRVDPNGKVTLDHELAGREILILIAIPEQGDKAYFASIDQH